MRRSVRRNTVHFHIHDSTLRKQLLLAIAFLVAIVAICTWNVRTYDPATAHMKNPEVEKFEKLEASNQELEHKVKSLKRQLNTLRREAKEMAEATAESSEGRVPTASTSTENQK
jgi:peptidoglycan hydrolase CwlO-like protein